MSGHAFLSPSASHRWLVCPPSAKLCAGFPDEAGPYAEEGTCAHELCAHLVEKALGRSTKDPAEDLSYYSEEMRACAEEYAAFVMEEYETAKLSCPDTEILVEYGIDYSRWVRDGRGTADCIIISDGTAEIIDYKHGLGVPVSASSDEFGGNPQLMCYALGMLEAFYGIYDVETVKTVIFQPRRNNISTHVMSCSELFAWADEVLAPTAALAMEGKGEFRAGDHCRFCKAKAVCRKRAEYNLQLAAYDFAMPDTLDEREIDVILRKADGLAAWVSDVKEYALAQALRGTEYESFKVVEGRSNRKYTDEEAVARAVTAAGFDPYEKKLLGITAMTAMLGKKRFAELLGTLTHKPQGKPALVPKTDERPAINNNAINDFKE